MKLTESAVWMHHNCDLLLGFGAIRMEVKFPREENSRRQPWHQRLHPDGTGWYRLGATISFYATTKNCYLFEMMMMMMMMMMMEG